MCPRSQRAQRTAIDYLVGLNPCSCPSTHRSPFSRLQQQLMRTRPRLSRCTNMAARGRRSVLTVAFILVLFLVQATSVKAKTFPTPNKVKEWATHLGNHLERVLDVLSGYHNFNLTFNEAVSPTNVEFHDVEPEKLVEKMATTLSEMLSKKMDALWLLVQDAENFAKNYSFNNELEKDQVSNYNNSKSMEYSFLTYDKHFGQEVSFDMSSVHIPVEIYDGDVSILNGLQWTSELDAQFRENYEADKEILWQFFGSQLGFMRTYPASKWNTHDQVDLFDVRRQSWYIQGSSSPKDMMILIDTSGSTHGQALQLMKNAVKSILDTLGENDFVNIVQFNQDADFVSDCFNHTAFVQANYRNKKQLEKDVDKLKAQGQANYQVGLRFAFKKFEEFNQNKSDDDSNMGANCNKVIILLTDGGTDNAEEVFQQYNWPNKTVRVFTYAVGPTATPVAAIRWMACANRGYFSQIPAMGAIRARVQDYLEVMGRPLALNHVKHTQWTSSHKTPLTDDISEHTHYLKQGMEQLYAQPYLWEITVEPRGLDMMTTVTLPVYNKTGSSNQTILGVMGIDVPTTELGKRTPFIEIGPVGYSFAINPNGYAVFHPNLKRKGQYMKDPPNIDLLELELEHGDMDQMLELRNKMIEGMKSQMEITDVLFLSPDKKYVTRQRATYAFTDITNTTFRLGLCVPEFQKKYLYFTQPDLPNFTVEPPSNKTPAYLIAPWDFLGSSPTHDLNSSLASLVDAMKCDGNKDCLTLTDTQKQMLHHLYLGVKGVRLHVNYPRMIKDLGTMLGFKTSELLLHFIATSGGLTVVYPPEQASQFDNDLDVRNSTYFKQAMYHSSGYVFIPDQYVNNKTEPAIIAARVVNVTALNHSIAVNGVKLTAEGLRNYSLELLRNLSITDRSINSMMTCNDPDIVCYLVDNGGFLVSSNQINESYSVGMFLGEVDPQLWSLLAKENIYDKVEQYDFQAMCKVEKDTSSAGHRSVLVPSVNMLFETLTASWWTSKVAWAYTSFNIYSWLFGDSGGAYGQVLEAADREEEEDKDEEECVLATQQFYLLPENAEFSGRIECEAETRPVLTQPALHTNLLLIVSTPPCLNPDQPQTPVMQNPYQLSKEEERNQVCMLARHPRKRVQSYGCYDSDPNEDDSKCGAAAVPGRPLVALLGTVVTLVAVTLLSTARR